MYDEERFRSRSDAGRILASHLASYAGRGDVLVLALPRGGVPVGFEIAQALRAPLDIFLVQKLGVPGQEELAMGAVASGNVRVLNSEVVQALRVPASAIEQATREALQEAMCQALDLPPGDCVMVAAHANDLLAAAKCGLRTAHLARPNERGPGKGEAAPAAPVDIAARDVEGLAAKLDA